MLGDPELSGMDCKEGRSAVIVTAGSVKVASKGHELACL